MPEQYPAPQVPYGINLLKVGAVMNTLQIAQTTLQRLNPSLHYMQLPASTRLYPIDYISKYRTRLWLHHSMPKLQVARDFAQTDEARAEIERAEHNFEEALQDVTTTMLGEPVITSPDIVHLLGVGRATVTAWIDRDQILQPLNEPSAKEPYFIPVDNFREVYEWHRPEV